MAAGAGGGQLKIDAESVWARRWANVKGQRAQRVEELLEELHRLDVGAGGESLHSI